VTQKWLLNKIKLNHFYTEVICMVPHCPHVFVKISHYAHFREVWYTVIRISEREAPSIRLMANFELPLFNFAWVIFCLLAIDPWNAQNKWNYEDKIPVCCWLIILLYNQGRFFSWIFCPTNYELITTDSHIQKYRFYILDNIQNASKNILEENWRSMINISLLQDLTPWIKCYEKGFIYGKFHSS